MVEYKLRVTRQKNWFMLQKLTLSRRDDPN